MDIHTDSESIRTNLMPLGLFMEIGSRFRQFCVISHPFSTLKIYKPLKPAQSAHWYTGFKYLWPMIGITEVSVLKYWYGQASIS